MRGNVATALICVMSCASLMSCYAGGSDAIEVSSLFLYLTVDVIVFEGGHRASSVSLCRDPLEPVMLLESK